MRQEGVVGRGAEGTSQGSNEDKELGFHSRCEAPLIGYREGNMGSGLLYDMRRKTGC